MRMRLFVAVPLTLIAFASCSGTPEEARAACSALHEEDGWETVRDEGETLASAHDRDSQWWDLGINLEKVGDEVAGRREPDGLTEAWADATGEEPKELESMWDKVESPRDRFEELDRDLSQAWEQCEETIHGFPLHGGEDHEERRRELAKALRVNLAILKQ